MTSSWFQIIPYGPYFRPSCVSISLAVKVSRSPARGAVSSGGLSVFVPGLEIACINKSVICYFNGTIYLFFGNL